MSLAEIAPFFDMIEVSPRDWPQACLLAVPNGAALGRWPNFPTAALPARGRAGSGCGSGLAAAESAALGEAVEIASLCLWGDEEVRQAPAADLSGRVLLPQELSGFSAAQLEQRDVWNDRIAGIDWIASGFNPRSEIRWVRAAAAGGGAAAWVPVDSVYLGAREARDEEAVAIADTSGAAVGTSDADARTRALLELIERDATGRWWYGRRARPLLTSDQLAPGAAALHDGLRRQGCECRLYDITTDIGVPVVAAVGAVPGTGAVAVGFAARPLPAEAADRALAEMVQMLLKIEGARITGQASPALARWLTEVRFATPPLALGIDGKAPDAPPGPTGTDMIGRLARCGVRVWFLNHSRPEFGVPVWRAISPDLCHWKPRLGRARLLAPDLRDLNRVSAEPNPMLLAL